MSRDGMPSPAAKKTTAPHAPSAMKAAPYITLLAVVTIPSAAVPAAEGDRGGVSLPKT